MMKKLLCFILYFPVCYFITGQPPTHLATDLLEHTDRVFFDGYPSDLSLSELGSTIERRQTAAIRSATPFLGWVVNSDRPNTLQTAYQIMVASSRDLLDRNEADMWNSNRTESDESVAVLYRGKPLQTSTVYHWKVKIWDNHGNETPWSAIRSFITADKFDDATSQYPLQISDEHPALIKKPSAAHYFIDFGKAAFGQLQLTLTAAAADTLTVHLGEALKNGRINRKPPGSVRYAAYKLPLTAGTHTYIVKIRPDQRNTNVKGGAILMPDYIGEVFPFRYCEIENCRPELAAEQIVRRTVHYQFNDGDASFHSSDTVLNQVWELCKYSVKAISFLGICVDGDRERIPYEGDIIIGQRCYYTATREYSFVRHSHEYLIKHPTWPTEWILQSVLLAWTDYLYTGNSASLQRYYGDLQAKTLSALRESNGLISTQTEKLTPEVLKSIHRGKQTIRDIVDWPQTGTLGLAKNEGGESDGYVFTTYNTVVNAYHYETLRLLGLIAEALGKTADATRYAAEAQQVKTQINRLLLDTKKGYYIDGIEDADHSSLHASMFPLAFGIVPQKYVKTTLDFIRSRGMACSVYGSQFLLDALYDHNAADYALQLLASTAERSWYNMIREGATITMEAWDQKYKPNQDWNHIWGAAAGNIIPRKLMGIEPLEPGFRRIRIKPQPSTLRHAQIRMPSVRGDVGVSFDNQPNEKFEMEIEIPANTMAEVWLPRLSTKPRLTVDGVSQKGETADRFIKVAVGSGKHQFKIEP